MAEESQSDEYGTVPAEIETPAEREAAYHEFKTTADKMFKDHPDRVMAGLLPGKQIIRLGYDDPNLESSVLTRVTPGTKPHEEAFIQDVALTVHDSNGQTVYCYTRDKEVVKWRRDKEKMGALPEFQAGEAGGEEYLLKLQEVARFLKEVGPSLQLEKQMGVNGQPISATETHAAIAIMKGAQV